MSASSPASAPSQPTVSGSARRRWTLRRSLLVVISAVMAALILAVAVLSIVIVRSSIAGMVESQSAATLATLERSGHKYRPHPGQTAEASGFVKPMAEFVGFAPGTLIALVRDGAVVDSARFTEAGGSRLSDADAALLADGLAASSGDSFELDLGGEPAYLVEQGAGAGGDTLVSGISLASAETAVRSETIGIVLLSITAIVSTIAAIALIVSIALRPLRRMAATASAVARMPLDRGEVELRVRVPREDADEATEVGMVGAALNRLLGHVAGALAVREATDRRMRRFLTDASHELRTPLTAIQGYAELTRQENGSLPPRVEHALSRIESEAGRMGSLVAQLLLLARLDEGQDFHEERVDLARLVVDAVSDLVVAGPDHAWVLEVPETPVVVLGDRERLHQVVANLLANARAHTPAGTRVTTRVELAGDRVVLTVEDRGPGIDPAVLPVVFERFVRSDGSRSRRSGGTGLGLAIAAAIVEAHRGEIRAESRPGGGATFTVTLPAVVGAAGDEEGAGPDTMLRPGEAFVGSELRRRR